MQRGFASVVWFEQRSDPQHSNDELQKLQVPRHEGPPPPQPTNGKATRANATTTAKTFMYPPWRNHRPRRKPVRERATPTTRTSGRAHERPGADSLPALSDARRAHGGQGMAPPARSPSVPAPQEVGISREFRTSLPTSP